MPSILSRIDEHRPKWSGQSRASGPSAAPATPSLDSPAHARSFSTPETPTLSSYADWERETARDRRARSRSNTQTAASPPSPSQALPDGDDDNALDAGNAPPPPYSRAKPPRYAAAATKPQLQHTHSLPVAEATSYTQAGFPRELPARGSGGPQNTMSMGEVQRWDGRRPCKVGRDGRCQCGKQVMRPNVVEGETDAERIARRRREVFDMKSKGFWGMMGMSFARAFLI